MTTQEDIYTYLKETGAKFKVSHLAKLFKYHENTMRQYLSRMMNNQNFYPGLERETVKATNKRGVEYLCYLFSVDSDTIRGFK